LTWREAEIAARAVNVQLLSLQVSSRDDFDQAFEAMRSQRADALLDLGDSFVILERARVLDFITRARLPAIWASRSWVEDGGLMGYAIDFGEVYRQAARYVDKILKGAQPGDLPVEVPTKFDFVINLKTAQALGLTIPPSVLQQATEILQ